MGTHAVLMMGMAAASLQGAAPDSVVLHNKHLTATFEESDAGPRLMGLRRRSTGTTHHFEDSQSVSLFVVPADVIHDPALPVEFEDQKDFSPDGVEVAKDKTNALFRFQHPLVQVDVSYELEPGEPALRKTIVCRAKDKPVYIAGVRQWMLKPAGLHRAWPKSETVGQPVVLLNGDTGCLLTLEWPRAQAEYRGQEIIVSYRPGYRLDPQQTQQVSTGSIVLFDRTFEDQPLEAARHAFFAHVARRVKPKVPCPIKFTTWGPWMRQARADRILEIVDDLAYVGTDLLHFDAGWQWPDHPYSQRMPPVQGADDATWDKAATLPERVPDGLLPLVKAAQSNGMELSLWFDAGGCVFIRETEDWAVRDEQGKPVWKRMWEGRWPKAPVQSLASEYGDRLREFVLEAMERYDLGGVMFDDNNFLPNHATDHDGLASGWDALDVQLRRIMEIFDECERRRPGIYRFFCRASSWPWALLHTTHIHAGDPGTSGKMREAVETDYPARAMAYERRLAWKRHYDNFVPPWGVKGDIAGWSLQQRSPIPVNLAHTGQLIPSGEGWTQNMFTCFATTCVRDIRFSFKQMPEFDRDVLKEWLAWDRKRSQFIFNCRPLFEMPKDPNRGITGFSHVGNGRGVVYLFNCSFDRADAELLLDENVGFRPGDAGVSAYIVYPIRARLARGKLSYGEILKVPIAAKDCLVIEIGLEEPEKPAPYADYEKTVASVKRSFDTLFMVSVDHITEAMKHGPVRIEIGDSKRDRILASQIIETLSGAIGRRISIDECLAVPLADSRCRLIIGTHEGLSNHHDLGLRFRETLYSHYLEWDGMLISAPLAVEIPGEKRPTFCLIAPRPEQLARLAINLVSEALQEAKPVGTDYPDPQWDARSIAGAVPANRPVLRFRPLMKTVGAITMPNDLDLVRYEIHLERDGERTLLWNEDIAPFCTVAGEAGWWGDRIISIADLAGQEATFHFTAGHRDGREKKPMALGGFDHIALLSLNSDR